MSEINKAVEMTYNQKAMQLVSNMTENDFKEIYEESIDEIQDRLDNEYMFIPDCRGMMGIYAGFHAHLFAVHLLFMIFDDEVAQDIWDAISNTTEFAPEHLQHILDELDGGRTVNQILNGDYDEDEEMDDE